MKIHNSLLAAGFLALASLLPGVRAAEVIQVGSEVEFPPYALLDKDGRAEGFSVELIEAVAKATGIPIAISTGAWDTMWNGLVEGRLDVLPVVAQSAERRKLVDFSLDHTETFDAFFVRDGDPAIPSLAAARGRHIVVMRSDAAHHELLARNFEGPLILVDTIPAGLKLVASGQHDAFLCSKLIGVMALKQHAIRGLSAGPLVPEYKRVFAFGVKKGRAELVEKLNQGLLIIKANGEYARIYDKWLSLDGPWHKYQRYAWPVLLAAFGLALAALSGSAVLGRQVRRRTAELAANNAVLAQEIAARRQLEAELRKHQDNLESLIEQRTRSLQHSEETYRLLFETVPQGVVYHDAEGAIISANPAAERILGLSLAQMQKRLSTDPCWHSVHEDGTPFPGDQHPAMVSLRSGRPVRNTVMGVFNPATEATAWINVNSVPLFDAAGQIRQVYATFDDISERKQAEQVLRDSEYRLRETETQLRLILDTVAEGIYGMDNAGLCTFINPAALEMLGYDHAGDLLGRDIHTLIHSADADGPPVPKARCPVCRALDNGPANREDQIFTRTDGSRFPVWLHARPIRPGRQTRGVVVSFMDITERKEMESLLQREKARAQQYLDLAGVIIVAIDADQRVSMINRKGAEILGYSEAEIVGRDWFERFLPERERGPVKAVLGALLRGEAKPMEYYENRVLARNGDERLIAWHNTVLRDGSGTVVSILASGEDISKRRQAEQALRESEARFRGLFDNMWNGVAVYATPDHGQSFIFKDHNKAGERLGGVSREQVVGKRLDTVFPGAAAMGLMDVLRRVWQTGKPEFLPLTHYQDQRVQRWVENYIYKLPSGEVVAVYDDITERKQAQEDLQRAKDELEVRVAERTESLNLTNRALEQAKEAAEAANRAKSIFLANMSHELRTPLNAVLGFSQLLANDPGISPRHRQNLDTINRAGEHLLAMINDVLDLSKIEAGRIEIHNEACPLPDLLHNLADLFRGRAEAKGLAFALKLDDNLPRHVQTDRGKLRQVIMNLLDNAIKFSDGGGVSLSACALPPALDDKRPRLRVKVRDSGIGIPAAQIAELFKPFVQLAGNRPEQKGTGLGLAISRKFIELLDGRMTVRSTPGQGSVFSFELPVTVAEGAENLPQAPILLPVCGLQPNQPAWRVLVVEDDEPNRTLLTQLLSQVGFAVREAQNGAEAVALFQSWSPHFIWLDISMPVLDGHAAARQIRALAGGDQVKIVALTANAFQEHRDQALSAGCDDLLSKPYEIHDIFAMMAKYLKVRYRYRNTPGAPANPARPLRAEDLAHLPRARLEALHHALLMLDPAQIETAIAEIQPLEPVLTGRISALAKKYDYQRLCELCEATLGVKSE